MRWAGKVARRRKRLLYTEFRLEILQGAGLFGGINVNLRIILKWILNI
jgi:hypothetical protein